MSSLLGSASAMAVPMKELTPAHLPAYASAAMMRQPGSDGKSASKDGTKEPANKEDKQKSGGGKCPFMTSAAGVPAPDMTHSMNIQGHPLTSDAFLMEKIQTFNRSKLVERHVHPCGSGAFGYFKTTADCSRWTKAKLFNGTSTQTPVFVRFSTVTLGREFPDSARNPRGFALKFYTEDGNYDLVGLNWPVFFVRDPMMGPDVIRSQQRNPKNFLIDFQAQLDWMSLVPESMLANTMYWSDHGTPRGWRYMHGYGCHTFKWVNAEGKEVYVKYHFRSEVGRKDFTFEEAQTMCGTDPDYAKRDLFEWIESGKEAKWTAFVQIMTPEQAEQALAENCNPFDVTKTWSRQKYPMHEIGQLVLNKNPTNYHTQVEQAAFSPGSLVPGIEPSPDLLLQMRCFYYRDTQYYRLGVNLHQIPVNAPVNAKAWCPFARDGMMRIDANGGDQPHYYPNSMPGGAHPNPLMNWKPLSLHGMADRRQQPRPTIDSDLQQTREFLTKVMSAQEKKNLYKNMAEGLKWCAPAVQLRMLAMCHRVLPEYAQGVASNLKGAPSAAEIAKYAETHTIDTEHGYMEVEVGPDGKPKLPTQSAMAPSSSSSSSSSSSWSTAGWTSAVGSAASAVRDKVGSAASTVKETVIGTSEHTPAEGKKGKAGRSRTGSGSKATGAP